MNEIDSTPKVVRYYLLICNSAILVWLIYLSAIAVIRVPSFMEMFVDMGSALPKITFVLEATYKYFAIAPIVGTIFTIDLLRRKKIPTIYAVSVFLVNVILGGIMHFIFHEGMFAPLWALANPVW